jgi:MFS family permease
VTEHPSGAPPATEDLTDPSQPVAVPAGTQSVWSPWRAVVGFGVVSLASDMVYEGARSVTGPLLASLGASAVVVGLVTGAGEAAALVLRLVFGPLADRSGRYWSLTLVGYGLTAICVPLLAVTPFIGAAGLAVACSLILAERTGKAVRSPSKSALLAQVATKVGRGRGFAIHKALDQVGAFSGPLLVAAIVAVTGVIWPAMTVLAVPGAASMALLVWLQRHIPAQRQDDTESKDRSKSEARRPTGWTRRSVRAVVGAQLPRDFFWFAASSGAATAGLVTFGVISYHLTTDNVLPLAAVPLVYAAGMAAAALAALITGFAYDRLGGRVLFALPAMIAGVPALAFSRTVALAVTGVLLWGAAFGLQDSTVKALVADLVPASHRATAYGVFAAVQGAAAIIGGGAAGALYSRSVPLLVTVVATTQLAAVALLVITLRPRAPRLA